MRDPRLDAARVARLATTDPLAEKYPQYRVELPDGAVLAVDVTEVRWWTASAHAD